MAKKAKVQHKGELVAPQPDVLNMAVDARLNMDDILSVVTTRAESTYVEQIGRCKEEIVVAQKARDVCDKEIRKIVADAFEKAAKAKAASLEKAVNAASSVKHTVKPKQVDLTDTAIVGQLEISPASQSERNNRGSFGVTFKVPLPVAVKKLQKDREVQQVLANELMAEAVDWKRKKANVPMLERQYRAKIAEQRLSQAEGGDELLELLTGDLENDILSLPGV